MNKKLSILLALCIIKSDPKSKLVLHGNYMISKAAVMQLLKDADLNDPNEVRIALSDTEYFSEVETKRKGNEVHVYLTELPLISKIHFTGNSQFKDEQCEKIVDLKAGSPCDKYTIQNAILRLEKAYAERYMNVSVQYRIKQENRALNVEFIIDEGGSGKISEVDFLGVKVCDKNRLKKLLPKNKLGLFSYTYDLVWLDMYKKMIADYAHSLGLYNLTIKHIDVVKTSKDHDYKLIITLDEGLVHKVADYKVKTTGLKLSESVSDIPKNILQKGSLLNTSRIKNAGDSIIKKAYNEGLDIGIKTSVNKLRINNNVQEVEVIFEAVKTQPTVINQIELSGNNLSEKQMIMNISKLMPGQKVNQFALIEARRKLESTGFFKSVEVDIDSQSEGLANVKINVAENNTTNLVTQFQLGYGNAPTISKDTQSSELFYGVSLGYQTANLLGKGYMFDAGIQYLFSTIGANISFGQSPQVTQRDFGWNIGADIQWTSSGIGYSHNYEYMNSENEYLLEVDAFNDLLVERRAAGKTNNPRKVNLEWDVISSSVSYSARFNITDNLSIGLVPAIKLRYNDLKDEISDYPRVFGDDYWKETLLYPNLIMPVLMSYKTFKHGRFFGFAHSIAPEVNQYRAALKYTAGYNLPIDDDGYGEIGFKVDAGTMHAWDENTYWQNNFFSPGVMTGIASWGPKELTTMVSLGGRHYATARARVVVPLPGGVGEYVRVYAFAALGTIGKSGIDGKPIDEETAREIGIKEEWTKSDIVNDDFSLRATAGAGVILAVTNSMYVSIGYNHPIQYNGPFDRPNYLHFALTTSISD